jgi:hypothetical protein
MDPQHIRSLQRRIEQLEGQCEQLREAFVLTNQMAKQVRALAVAYELLAEQIAMMIHAQTQEPEGPKIIIPGAGPAANNS